MRHPAMVSVALLLLAASWLRPPAASAAQGALSVTDYASIQEALDANPGRMIHVPPGDYEISERIVIRHDGSGLYGYGRIVQTNPTERIILVEDADDVRLIDLTLTRPDDKPGKTSALFAGQCRNLVVRNLQVINTRAPHGAINLDSCNNSQVLGCLVQNYVAVSIEDRTGDENAGYAYKTLDGTGIQVDGVGILIQGNRIIQTELFPTPETQKEHQLGDFVKKNDKKGASIGQEAWDEGHTNGWNQGAAIYVGEPQESDCIQIIGNYVENAAQAVDIHADRVILANNITNNTLLGMKAVHGSRNVLILGNQFSKANIGGVVLSPGVASHAAGTSEDYATRPDANVDGGHIVANNIISDFGYGTSHWLLGNDRFPLEFGTGQEPDDPPLQDVIVTGNIVYDPARDGIPSDGGAETPEPRYPAAVVVFPGNPEGPKGPRNILFHDNILHAGRSGIAVPDELDVNGTWTGNGNE